MNRATIDNRIHAALLRSAAIDRRAIVFDRTLEPASINARNNARSIGLPSITAFMRRCCVANVFDQLDFIPLPNMTIDNLLYGLVLAGGHSSRMGRDKGLLDYRGMPHRFYLESVLKKFCARVLLSINASQEQVEPTQHDYIVDHTAYENTGPIGAVLNAHEGFPDAALFVVSCDLPYFNETCAKNLIDERDPSHAATAFFNPEAEQPEPLVTIYENVLLRGLGDSFRNGENSLRRLLKNSDVTLVHQYNPRCIQGADTQEAYEEAKRWLAERD
jgi:molybdopterin-guanine dinucleotide biosynthesis protein A